MSAPFGRRRATITSREDLGPYVILRTDDDVAVEPGQFFMVAAVERWGGGEDERPFLPRAFSSLGERAAFLFDAVGPGTARLAELGEGDELWLTGPLGNGFPAPEGRPLLVGGGIGVPPIAFLAARLRGGGAGAGAGARAGGTTILGFRDAHHAAGAAVAAGDVRIATDDGSVGHHGFVTDLLAAELDAGDGATVYACGPPGMLEAIRGMCVERGVTAHLALEAAMACGFGACFGCVVPLAGGGYARTCVDGPVMEAAVLAEVPA